MSLLSCCRLLAVICVGENEGDSGPWQPRYSARSREPLTFTETKAIKANSSNGGVGGDNDKRRNEGRKRAELTTSLTPNLLANPQFTTCSLKISLLSSLYHSKLTFAD